MNTRLKSYSHAVFVMALFATFSFMISSSYGQTPLTLVWTNQNPAHPAGSDFAVAANWLPASVPQPMTPTPDANGAYGDLLMFDGQTTGALKVTAVIVGFGGQTYPAGLRVLVTS